MTEAAFCKALRELEGAEDVTARKFKEHTPEAWTEGLLRYGPALVRRKKRALWGMGVCIAVSVAFWLVYMFTSSSYWHRLILTVGRIGPWIASSVIQYRIVRPWSLVARLDDVRLVPFWLDALPSQDSPRRAALRERLIRHLPNYWLATGETLPKSAQAELRREIRRFAQKGGGAEDAALVTAALICLDNDARRGVPVDAKTSDAFARLRLSSDERVQAAAEDALQRLRRTP